MLIFKVEMFIGYASQAFPNAVKILSASSGALGVSLLIAGLLMLTGYNTRNGALLGILIGIVVAAILITSGHTKGAIYPFSTLCIAPVLIVWLGAGKYSVSQWLKNENG